MSDRAVPLLLLFSARDFRRYDRDRGHSAPPRIHADAGGRLRPATDGERDAAVPGEGGGDAAVVA